MLKKTISFSSFFLLIIFIYSGLPYENLSSSYQFFLSITRILYFSIFIIYSFKLKELSYIQFNKNYKELNIICNILAVVSLLIVLGIFTKFFVLLHLVLYLYLFRKSRANFYGIEQSYHQIFGLFFIFSNSNVYFSFDKLFEIDSFLMFKDSTSLNFLVLSISVCLISGFHEKLNSKLWKSGKALNIFLNLPHIAKFKYNKTFTKIFFNKYVCYIALINQVLLFSLLFNELRIFFYIGELIFSISIMVMAPLHFIGATFVLIFSLLITTELVNLNYINFTQEIILGNNFDNFKVIDYTLGLLILNSFVACFYKTPIFFNKINRYTLGLSPFGVYTEDHINGIRVFKLSGFKNSKLIYNNLFEVYNENGGVGSKQWWMPSIIFGLTYRITDICERRLGKNSTIEDEKILISTFKNIINLNKKKFNDIDVLKFYIKTINPESCDGNIENWIDRNWSEIAEYNITKRERFSWTNLPTKAVNFSRENR